MKKTFLIITVIGILISCSDKNDLDNIVIDGTFFHQIPDCEYSGNPEELCTELIYFNDNATANIIFGGADFGLRYNYLRNDDIIELTPEYGSGPTFSFKIQSESVLIRFEDNEIWNKEQ
jgi:hypothetical protein